MIVSTLREKIKHIIKSITCLLNYKLYNKQQKLTEQNKNLLHNTTIWCTTRPGNMQHHILNLKWISEKITYEAFIYIHSEQYTL